MIYVFRHAKSSWADHSLDDFDRPLARRGREATKVMRRYMAKTQVRPALVLCSPSARTRETLENVLPVLGDDVEVRHERALYLADAVEWLKRLRGVPDTVPSVMIVGHNPGVQTLAIALADGGNRDALASLQRKFPTAAMAKLTLKYDRWRDLAPGSCDLDSFVVPRELA